MTLEELNAILSDVRFLDRRFVATKKGDGFLVQIQYEEPDVTTGVPATQKGRKWYVSAHSVKSEVVRTCLKAALTSMEHVTREHFFYRGARIFSPHFDVDRLVELSGTDDAYERRSG